MNKNKYWSDLVYQVTPYTPGEQPKDRLLLKLNTNENPYGPSPLVIDAIKNVTGDNLRLYPDPESNLLKQALADYYDIPKSFVFVGNGSDEVLAFIFQSLLKKNLPILFPDITYSFYPTYCSLYGIQYDTISLDKNFNINLDDYLYENGGVIFPNPNAPTAIPKSLFDIEQFLKRNQNSVVVIDEAYVDFGAESAVKLIKKYDNLVITQSFSKSRSLAGLRLGCALAHEKLIQALVRVKDSFNSYSVDRLGQEAGIAAIKDSSYFLKTSNAIIETREFLMQELSKMNFKILPSAANFIFTKHNKVDAEELFNKLRDVGILVRHFNKPKRITRYLRITIGTTEEMKQLVLVLKKILE